MLSDWINRLQLFVCVVRFRWDLKKSGLEINENYDLQTHLCTNVDFVDTLRRMSRYISSGRLGIISILLHLWISGIARQNKLLLFWNRGFVFLSEKNEEIIGRAEYLVVSSSHWCLNPGLDQYHRSPSMT